MNTHIHVCTHAYSTHECYLYVLVSGDYQSKLKNVWGSSSLEELDSSSLMSHWPPVALQLTSWKSRSREDDRERSESWCKSQEYDLLLPASSVPSPNVSRTSQNSIASWGQTCWCMICFGWLIILKPLYDQRREIKRVTHMLDEYPHPIHRHLDLFLFSPLNICHLSEFPKTLGVGGQGRKEMVTPSLHSSSSAELVSILSPLLSKCQTYVQ